jgi:hypothetical protein
MSNTIEGVVKINPSAMNLSGEIPLIYQPIQGRSKSVAEIEDLVPTKLNDINSIIQRLVPPGTTITLEKEIDKGANNIIKIWKIGNDFIVSRIAIDPTFQLTNSNEISVFGKNRNAQINKLKRAIQSKKNWYTASEKGLAPHMYDYGYIADENGLFYNFIIYNNMDSDLESYYKSGPGKESKDTRSLQPADYEIAKQLVELLYSTTDEIGLICFDIKPANCLINYSDGNIVVKLIDWDGDWCQDYSHLTIKIELKKYISILSVMVMAAHFYGFLDWNIFYTYFSNPDEYGNIIRDDKVILKNLFCYDIKDKNGRASKFDFFQRHNFEMLDAINYDYLPCPEAFELTFERVHYLNREEKAKAKAKAKASKGGRKNIKSKTKKRKTKKRKTKKRKTKKRKTKKRKTKK